MKKIAVVSVASFLFLAIASVIAYVLRFIPLDQPLVLVCIGIFTLVASGVLAIFAKKKIIPNIICYLISAVALGLCIRAWYIFRGFDNPLWMILLVSLACVLYLWFFYVLAHIPFFEKHFTAFIYIFVALSFIAYLIVIFTTHTTFVSTFGYYMIIEIAFIFAMSFHVDTLSELIRNITLSTYSVFVVAVIITIMILSEGDGFDFDFIDIDFGGGSGTGTKKRVSITGSVDIDKNLL